MGLFDLFKKKPKKDTSQSEDTTKSIKKNTTVEKHKVTGTSHYIDNIMKFKVENVYYSETKKRTDRRWTRK